MSSAWRPSGREERGAYTSVAQTEDAIVELTAHGKELENGSLADEMAIKTPDNRKSTDNFLSDTNTPTAYELGALPHVADTLPRGAFLVAIVELCERFAYYGLSGPFQNYISNPPHAPSGLPGALGLSQPRATALTNFFQFWCYVTPILGAIVADQYLGKYRTIKWFSIVYMAGIAVLFVTSLPWCIERGVALPGLMVAMVVIGLGTGGIKSNVSPLIAEQVHRTAPFVKQLPSGKRVIVDPDVTVQRVYMVFYMCINIGSISAIATTTLELHVGFWSAYLLPLLMFCVGYAVLVGGKKGYVIKPPQGGVIGHCFRALWIAARNGFDLDAATPSFQPLNSGRRRSQQTPWDDIFIEELKTALLACKVFLFFPIYWLTYSQMLNNFVSQAGQMQLHSLPNDILPNIDPITIIILIPLLDRLIYPFLRTRLHLALTPTTRIASGFLLAAAAMAYAALLQSRIYAAPPCYTHPGACAAGKLAEGKYAPNAIHVAWQTPAYVLIALSEILASITGLELAYAKAPENMKSFIMSLFLLTSAGGSALGILVAPGAKDPHLVWLYTGLACAAAVAGGVFYWVFRGVDEGNGRQASRAVESADGDEGIELEGRKSEADEEERRSLQVV